MNSMNAANTNVYVYALDADEPVKQDAGVTILYSEDMDAGTNYDGLTIVNPFA